MAWFRFLATVSLLLVSSGSVSAAQDESFRLKSVFVDPAGDLSAVVQFPPGATPKSTALELWIDDKRAATAQEAQDQRLNMMFLVDVSGSMKGAPLNDTKNALASFLRMHPQEQFALTSFADKDTPRSALGDPRDKTEGALANLRVEGKTTKLYQALYNALQKTPKDDPQARHILVVVSDGKDEGSDVRLEQVIQESKAKQAPIYTVFRGGVEGPFADVLTGLANSTGGSFSSTHSRTEMANALDQIYRAEANSLAVRFSYPMDRTGRATESAAIKLRQPDGTLLEAKIPEKIPALLLPGQVKPSDNGSKPPTPRPFAPWYLWLLLAVLLVGGGGFWLWRRTRKTPEVPVPLPSVNTESPPPPEIPPPSPPRRRATVLISQYFPVPASGHPTVILRGVGGPVDGRQHAVEKDIFSIGAGAGNDLPIAEDEYVSGEHAYLRYETGSLFVFDKASRNGTFVNDGQVPETGTALRPGDRIKFGMSTFEVVMPSS